MEDWKIGSSRDESVVNFVDVFFNEMITADICLRLTSWIDTDYYKSPAGAVRINENY